MKNYEVISKVELLDEEGNPKAQLGIGEVLQGEPVDVDGDIYLQTKEGFVLMDSVAEKADESKSEVSIGDKPSNGMNPTAKKLIMALGAAAIGFAFASYKKMGTKKIAIFTIAGLAIGLTADYFINKRKEG